MIVKMRKESGHGKRMRNNKDIERKMKYIIESVKMRIANVNE